MGVSIGPLRQRLAGSLANEWVELWEGGPAWRVWQALLALQLFGALCALGVIGILHQLGFYG